VGAFEFLVWAARLNTARTAQPAVQTQRHDAMKAGKNGLALGVKNEILESLEA
jgi:hypothetical protein